MTSSQIGMLISMIAYLALMLYIGFKVADRNNSLGDFYLGGRKLGPFVTAMSAEASDMSSWLLMGIPGLAYLSGIADPFWTCAGLCIGTYLNWLIVAKRLRKYTEVTRSITIPEFFSNRYGDKRKTLTLIAAIIIIVFFVPYTASGFAACGKLFSSLFGLDYHAAMIFSALVIIGYTSLGGFLAASTTDLIQSIVMSIALLIVLIFGTVSAGGMNAVFDNARSMAGFLSLSSTHDAATGGASPYSALTIVSVMAWGLGYFGMPHILLRFMAIEDDSKLKLSRRIASVWVVIAMGVAILIGLVGNALSSEGIITKLTTSGQSETVIVRIADLLAQYGIPCALAAGIVLSGILASTMSTADSQLLAASSSVTNDIVVNVFHAKITDQARMYVARASLLIEAVVAIFIAWDPDSSVFQIVSFAWAGFGAAFGPIVLLALFWKRSNRYGALAGMISGGVMVFVWKFLIAPIGGSFAIYELLPAFIVAIAVNVIVSLLTRAPEKELTDTFEEVRKLMKS